LILAGDVGGTKCNLALFSEKGGNLSLVFRQRFASKEFAQFERIVKEFSRQAADHLGGEPSLPPDLALPALSSMAACAPRTFLGL